jgi:hypothetical protein
MAPERPNFSETITQISLSGNITGIYAVSKVLAMISFFSSSLKNYCD